MGSESRGESGPEHHLIGVATRRREVAHRRAIARVKVGSGLAFISLAALAELASTTSKHWGVWASRCASEGFGTRINPTAGDWVRCARGPISAVHIVIGIGVIIDSGGCEGQQANERKRRRKREKTRVRPTHPPPTMRCCSESQRSTKSLESSSLHLLLCRNGVSSFLMMNSEQSAHVQEAKLPRSPLLHPQQLLLLQLLCRHSPFVWRSVLHGSRYSDPSVLLSHF
jgi:hypothetical protein